MAMVPELMEAAETKVREVEGTRGWFCSCGLARGNGLGAEVGEGGGEGEGGMRRTANMGRMRMGSTGGMEALGSPWRGAVCG